MQEIVDEYGTFVVKPEAQHDPSMSLNPHVHGKIAALQFFCMYHISWQGGF